MKKKIVLVILILILMFTITGCGNEYREVIGEYTGLTSLDNSGEYRDANGTSLVISKDGTFKFTLSQNYILTGNLELDTESNDVEKSFILTNLDKDDASGYIYTCYENDAWSNPYVILITEKNQYIFSFKKVDKK